VLSSELIIVVVIALIVVVGILAFVYVQRKRSEQLQARFGPEYERAVRQQGDPRRAEAVLLDREERVEKYRIRELDPAERERFATEWRYVQQRFVDDPRQAVIEADSLVSLVMQARGYPMMEFDQRADDLSVDHPLVVENYRVAHGIALRHQRGQASTEDLRQAMIHYRSLFDDLLVKKQPSREAA
jgi:hypothetical protein